MKRMLSISTWVFMLNSLPSLQARDSVESALELAGENRIELEKALKGIPASRKAGMQFLIRYMPEPDLKTLAAPFLLENVSTAYEVWEKTPWKDRVPVEIFMNDVLPYANVNEKRDNWRRDFYDRFHSLIEHAKTPSEAAAILNNNVFKITNVKYSRRRRKPDQSPSESMETGLASCTGLSIILIDACRAVGVPARFAGTPLWSDRSGNHSWVEVWDDGWHFTGACEPTGMELDKGWFIHRATAAKRNDRRHAIYAVSYKHTPITFPIVWNRTTDYVYAVNVTDRYTSRKQKLPEGFVRVMFRALNEVEKERVSAELKIMDSANKPVFHGKTNDESFDGNDHLSVPLVQGETYKLQLAVGTNSIETSILVKKPDELFSYTFQDSP